MDIFTRPRADEASSYADALHDIDMSGTRYMMSTSLPRQRVRTEGP